jgi:hypothetical protein
MFDRHRMLRTCNSIYTRDPFGNGLERSQFNSYQEIGLPSSEFLPKTIMIRLTPGSALLLRCLPVGFVPIVVLVALQQLGILFAVAIPTWVYVIASVSSLPIYVAALILFKIVVDRARAASMGASLPPTVRSDSIGNLGIQHAMVHNFKYGYPGTLLSNTVVFTDGTHGCCPRR